MRLRFAQPPTLPFVFIFIKGVKLTYHIKLIELICQAKSVKLICLTKSLHEMH